MSVASETRSLFESLRRSADADVAAAIERLVRDGADRDLCRLNALGLAATVDLPEEAVIAGLLHAARLGIFELAWTVLCPACGSVLDVNASLGEVAECDEYHCGLCTVCHESRLDDMVEVTFTVSPRARRIAAHDPDALPLVEFCRQIAFGSSVALPEDLERVMGGIVLESVELPAGGTAVVSLTLPPGRAVVFDPVTHTTRHLTVTGEPTGERQFLALVIDGLRLPAEPAALRPGPLRLTLENRAGTRVLPRLWADGEALHRLLGRHRPFLTAKRLLTNHTFRDIYRAETLAVDQRLRITSLTFLFTDLVGSTAFYERAGDLMAFDLVRAHFRALREIAAREGGAVVKTIGDAVMATFPAPDRAVAAALRMREAVRDLGEGRGDGEDLLLKIGIHEGPCLAVALDERQDYFGQTVNIASRLQGLAAPPAILATGSVVGHLGTVELLGREGLEPVGRSRSLRGIGDELTVYETP